jgi:dUTP pyrophosphatase
MEITTTHKVKYSQISNKIKAKVVPVTFDIQIFKHSEGDAGYDLYATEDKWIWPFRISKIPTNCMIEIPEGFYGEVTGRSGQTTLGNVVIKGTVDNTYRGIVHIMMYRVGLLPRKIKKGTRVAQLIICPYAEVDWEITTKLSESKRGQNGFGHTGIT